MPATRRHSCCRCATSSEAVGSSSSSTRGSPSSPIARLSRWTFPTESCRSAPLLALEPDRRERLRHGGARDRPSRQAARRDRGSRAASAAGRARAAAASSRRGSRSRSAETSPSLGGERSGQDREQRRLAGTVRPTERHDLALTEVEVDRLEHHPAARTGVRPAGPRAARPPSLRRRSSVARSERRRRSARARSCASRRRVSASRPRRRGAGARADRCPCRPTARGRRGDAPAGLPSSGVIEPTVVLPFT